MKLRKKMTAILLTAIFMTSTFLVLIPVSADFEPYSYSESIVVSDGTVGTLEVTVTEDGDWVTWTFDFPVEQFTGDGNLNVGLIIATDGEGEGPAFQIHNDDGADPAYEDGTWLMSPWGPTISDGWLGWHSGDTNTLVTDLDWVEASGLRNTPWTGVIPYDGVMTISIKRAVLGNDFHWAASPTVGSGFWAPASDVTMQVPTAFDWGTPLVDMDEPNYMYALLSVSPTPPTKADILQDRGVPGEGIDEAPGLDKEPPNENFGGKNRKGPKPNESGTNGPNGPPGDEPPPHGPHGNGYAYGHRNKKG